MEKGIEYDIYDVAESDEIKNEFYELRKKYDAYKDIVAEGKRYGIPAFFYGDECVIGFDKEKLDKLLS